MRTVRVADSDSDHTWLWLTAGAALGIVAGVLVARRMKAKPGTLRSLAGRGRRLANRAMDSWLPLLETARAIKEAWDAPDEDEDDAWAEEPADAALETDADLDDADDEEEDDALDGDEADEGLDARVLEAFINDPILMDRAVEIEERDPGVIILHGRLNTRREAKHAVTIAKGVPGVERVRTRLTVR